MKGPLLLFPVHQETTSRETLLVLFLRLPFPTTCISQPVEGLATLPPPSRCRKPRPRRPHTPRPSHKAMRLCLILPTFRRPRTIRLRGHELRTSMMSILSSDLSRVVPKSPSLVKTFTPTSDVPSEKIWQSALVSTILHMCATHHLSRCLDESK